MTVGHMRSIPFDKLLQSIDGGVLPTVKVGDTIFDTPTLG